MWVSFWTSPCNHCSTPARDSSCVYPWRTWRPSREHGWFVRQSWQLPVSAQSGQLHRPLRRGRLAHRHEARCRSETEAVLTQTLSQSFPYIKTVILADYDFSAPVMANFKLRNGTYGANTQVFISFGFGLKRSIDQQLIIQNLVGPVCILFSAACNPFSFFLFQVQGEAGSRERKPHKAHKTHQPLPAQRVEKRNIAICGWTELDSRFSKFLVIWVTIIVVSSGWWESCHKKPEAENIFFDVVMKVLTFIVLVNWVELPKITLHLMFFVSDVFWMFRVCVVLFLLVFFLRFFFCKTFP